MSESKKELIEEHKRLTHVLKDGSSKERLEEYERQMKELKHLLATGKYKPEVVEGKVAKTKVDTTYHVPYLGGYSKDGSTIYIDSRFPKTIKPNGKKSIDAHKYLVVHEVTEKHLEDMGLDYNEAHNIAEATQEAALKLDGHDPEDYYGIYYKTYNQVLRDFDPKKVPEDLDLKPYEDDKLHSVIERIKGLNKAITPDPNYKGNHKAMVDGKWYRVKNAGVDKNRPIVSHEGENWYELEGHPEGVVHQDRLQDYDEGLNKSGYGPKGAGLYDPTVNIKRKENRTGEEVSSAGKNVAVHEYTSATMGTAKQQADTLATKQKKLNRRQPVKTLETMTDEEKAEIERKYNTKITKIEKSLKAMKIVLEKNNQPMNLQQILSEIKHRQPTDAEINFILSEQSKTIDVNSAEMERNHQEERYRQMCEEE